MLLRVSISNRVSKQDMPKTLYIFSDMEFDRAMTSGRINNDRWYYANTLNRNQLDTVIEAQARKWKAHGYELPRIIFWNLDARTQNIPALNGRFSYVSGFSPVMISAILSGKDGFDLMLEKIGSVRYQAIASVFD